ncbi:PEGA domain-containing protein [Candidatus Saccharibacteria bacterium]|nr:PEGA domain-containing protein [Candidatus Saccharibacteria bacterium]
MDFKDRERRHSIKVIASEAIMVLAIIASVIVLALLVSGYWLNSDLKVERQGMLQISSIPTGATIDIDGTTSSWLERTNTSKVLSAGEHTITLTKDGYDSWSRTINITEGLLYRIHYPRLFLNSRTTTPVYDASIVTFATVSPDGNHLLLANNTTSWSLLPLEDESPSPSKIDISSIFSSISMADGATTGLFNGEIISADWSEDNSHVLFKVKSDDTTEWVILNPKDTKSSINLTHEFATDFSRIKILDSSANTLLAIRDGNLHKIDVASRQISSILIKDIVDFDHYNSEIVFSAKSPDNSTATDTSTDATTPSSNTTTPSPDSTSSQDTISTDPASSPSTSYPYYIGYFKLGENKITTLTGSSTPAQVTISKFYDDKYITTLAQNTLTLYKKDDFAKILSSTLAFTPTQLKVGHAGEFIEATSNTNFATLDMEAQSVREWTIDSSHYGWLDHDMLYSISDGQLIVYDFDGLNRRIISKNVSERFPVAVTNDKWLYYFSDGKIIREVINK